MKTSNLTTDSKISIIRHGTSYDIFCNAKNSIVNVPQNYFKSFPFPAPQIRHLFVPLNNQQ